MIYKVIPKTLSKIEMVTTTNLPILDGKMVVAVKCGFLCLLVPTISAGKGRCVLKWHQLGRQPGAPIILNTFDSEIKAIEAAQNEDCEIFIFDTVKEMAKFIASH